MNFPLKDNCGNELFISEDERVEGEEGDFYKSIAIEGKEFELTKSLAKKIIKKLMEEFNLKENK